MHRSAILLALVAYVTPAEAERLDRRFVPAIRDAAAHYQTWGRVDEAPSLAPTLCRAPTPDDDHGTPSQVRMSRARGGPHEEKLYYLWANHKYSYAWLFKHETPLPIGFTVVKQSFGAKPMTGEPPALAVGPGGGMLTPPPITWMTARDGRRLQIDQPLDLYVMVKVGDRAGADKGWVYGTVAPDGTVTSAGRVASCMSCHESAKHDRMFGLPR